MTTPGALDIATRSSEVLWKNDDASKALGITLETVQPGKAILSLQVEKRHTNGHNICHGGVIFTLADTAFAIACNSYNQVAVAQQNSITFVTPGNLDDTLTATATELNRAKRSGVYDVVITNQNNDTVALFRGHSRTLNQSLFDE